MTKTFGWKTVDPKNPSGPKIEVTIPSDLVLRYFKHYPARYENFRVVEQVLNDPKRIFSGIRAINQGGWCYVGRPATWHIDEDTEVDFPKDKVYAVYLNDRLIIYEFRAEHADKEDPFSPKDWQKRFGGLIWKSPTR